MEMCSPGESPVWNKRSLIKIDYPFAPIGSQFWIGAKVSAESRIQVRWNPGDKAERKARCNTIEPQSSPPPHGESPALICTARLLPVVPLRVSWQGDYKPMLSCSPIAVCSNSAHYTHEPVAYSNHFRLMNP
jgi:hypothetical protein